MSSNIQIQQVQSKKQKKDFVDLPFSIYKGNAYWVPPIKADEMHLFDAAHNPAMDFCDTAYWVAYKNGKVVGRISAIINHKYNEKMNQKLGRFSRLEFFDDPEGFRRLMDTASQWLKDRKMEIIHGPLGFTNLDNQGLLIEGFEYLASVASVYHLPYYKKYLEAYGFKKETDWLEFRLQLGEKAINKAIRGSEIIKKRFGLQVIDFQNNKEIIPYVKPLFEILNQAFAHLPYVVSIPERMTKMYAQKYFKMINPRYVRMVKDGDEPVGFIVAVPSLSEAMQKANGKLFPFGFYHLMKAMKHPQVLDLFLGGVKPEYDKKGVAVILYAEIQKQMMKDGIQVIETTGNIETNHNVIANWKNFDHIQHKRRRCFAKPL